ncbi:MAG TPA: hypothetical protein VKR83_07420 [Ktedonobacteraceae bacterium]|nr:hypothetical protein [Ktedonobacteraceae bacterium]
MMDRAASAGFEGIAQMLLEQKKLMDALEAENRELRRQIADLRRGVGMAIVIDGKTIQLATETATGIQASAQSQATLQSLQNLQNSPGGNSYMSRQTGGQQAIGEKQNGNNRNPLADSFVL